MWQPILVWVDQFFHWTKLCMTRPSGHAGQSEWATVSVSADQFMELLAAIIHTQKSMDVKFAKFQEEVHQWQEEAATKALKRAKYEKPKR